MSEIDPQWLERELALINEKVTAQYPDIEPKTIQDTIEHSTGELVGTARIFNYLPILIQRRVQAQLQAIATGD
jgi:hypothetical protein